MKGANALGYFNTFYAFLILTLNCWHPCIIETGIVEKMCLLMKNGLHRTN